MIISSGGNALSVGVIGASSFGLQAVAVSCIRPELPFLSYASLATCDQVSPPIRSLVGAACSRDSMFIVCTSLICLNSNLLSIGTLAGWLKSWCSQTTPLL